MSSRMAGGDFISLQSSRNTTQIKEICHLSVTSCFKNFHCRYADRSDLAPLITVFRFRPSFIPQMSDIHIQNHFKSLKEEEAFFWWSRANWRQQIFGFWISLNYSICAYSRLNSKIRTDMQSRDGEKKARVAMPIPSCCRPCGRCSPAFQWEADKVIIRKGLRESESNRERGRVK